MKKISIVVPCYNEEETLPIFYEEMQKIVKEMSKEAKFEFVFVNDGSKDKTLAILRGLAKKDKNVRYLSFSRNFGKEAGIYAGLKNATGDYICTMDVDLQDPPSLLKEMFKTLETGEYDCCAAKSTSRNGYSFLRKTFTKWFYKLINKLSKVEMVDGARDFRLFTRQMLDSILEMEEYNRYSKGIFSFVGYNTKWLEYENTERVAGTTKWSFWKLFIYAIDGITAFSTTPLIISVFIGIIFCLIAFIMVIVVIIKTLVFGDPVSGWPSLACIIIFTSGVQLFFFGVMGMYLSKIYLEVKKRPLYIVDDKNIEKGNISNEKK